MHYDISNQIQSGTNQKRISDIVKNVIIHLQNLNLKAEKYWSKMGDKIMVYYDVTAWETVDIDNFDELKDRCASICSMLKELGIMSFKIRTGTEEEPIKEGDPVEQSAN